MILGPSLSLEDVKNSQRHVKHRAYLAKSVTPSVGVLTRVDGVEVKVLVGIVVESITTVYGDEEGILRE